MIRKRDHKAVQPDTAEKDAEEAKQSDDAEDLRLSPFSYSKRLGDPGLLEFFIDHAKAKPKEELDAHLGLRLPKTLVDQVNSYVEAGYRASASDFVRDSILLNLTVQEKLKEADKDIDEIAAEVMTEVANIGINLFLGQVMAPFYRVLQKLSPETLAHYVDFGWEMMTGWLGALCGVSDEMARLELMNVWLRLKFKAGGDRDDPNLVYDENLWSSIAAVIAGYTGAPPERAAEALKLLRTALHGEAATSGGVSDSEMQDHEA